MLLVVLLNRALVASSKVNLLRHYMLIKMLLFVNAYYECLLSVQND